MGRASTRAGLVTTVILASVVGIAFGVAGLCTFAYLLGAFSSDLIAHALAEAGLQDAAPAAPSPAALPVRAQSCSIPFCLDPVEVHIGAGYDEWPFCLTHGTPYLQRSA